MQIDRKAVISAASEVGLPIDDDSNVEIGGVACTTMLVMFARVIARRATEQERKPLSDAQTDALARSVFGWTDRASKALVKTTEAFLTGQIDEIPASGGALFALEDSGISVTYLSLESITTGITQEKQG